MSKIKDVQQSMLPDEVFEDQESKQVQQEDDYIPEAILPKDVKREDGFSVFKLLKSNQSGGVHIPNIDYVIDPRTITDEKPDGDGPEMIRLLQGVSTIWEKEQKNLPKEVINKNGRFISFPRGTRFISIPSWDRTALEFMDVCRHNIRNPNRKSGSKFEFFKWDSNEVAKAKLKKEMLEVNMVAIAVKQPLEKMKKHAYYLGITATDEIGRPKGEDRLRTDYMLAAKRDPKGFNESLDSKEVEVQYLIRAAIIDGKIDIGRGDGKIYWGNGGGLICSCPKSEQPLQYLTQLALTPNKDGKQFKELLEDRIT